MQNFFLLTILFSFCRQGICQTPAIDTLPVTNISITYNINITSKNNHGIAETYNGAVKTLYAKNERVKLRFVSLMRSQSIYYNYHAADTNATAIIAKESGKQKYKFRLTPSAWQFYNAKYEDAVTTFENDSISVIGYSCKKAIVTLKDQTQLIVWFFPATRSETLIAAEPMFAGIPGLPMQYELHEGKKMIVYTAKEISFQEIPSAIFQAPMKGYVTKKFMPGKSVKDDIEETE